MHWGLAGAEDEDDALRLSRTFAMLCTTLPHAGIETTLGTGASAGEGVRAEMWWPNDGKDKPATLLGMSLPNASNDVAREGTRT